MSRIKLRNGGKPRHKALLGADGAIMAAATLTAAAMNTAATLNSAKTQAKAMTENAKTQAKSIEEQTNNNNNLQKEQINFTRSQNQENRQQQQDIQTTLQLLAGQENMNDRMERNKMQVKLGGKLKRRSITTPFYGGGQFQVTDGGGVIPISVSPDGYGLYELFGNDHEHYHKTSGGKNKTGVGIKFNDGSVVEGEGNQNTNQGELLYITPNDAMFISKHSIDGFNPTEAVKQGVHPVQAFNIQEILKARKGLNDDGSKAKCGKRRSLKRLMGGYSPAIEQANMTQNPSNGTGLVSGGVIYAVNNKTTSPVEGSQYTNIAKCGKCITLKCGGRRKAALGYSKTGFWNDYGGAVTNAAGNVLGAGISTIGNFIASNKLSKAYNEAGNILANAYSQMHGIDLDEVKMEDFDAPHTLAVVRDANNINYNPQRERIRRNSVSERREINRGTLSSAARQQRLAATNDRMLQNISELSSNENTAREQIRQGNAERITQTAQANADRDVQARRDYGNQRLSLLQYNNNIENAKIAGMAQARADALTQSSMAHAQGMQTSAANIGSALANAGQGFASAYEARNKERNDFNSTYQGLGDSNQVTAAITRAEQKGDTSYVKALLDKYSVGSTKTEKDYYNQLSAWASANGMDVPEFTGSYRYEVPLEIQTMYNRVRNYKAPSINFGGNSVSSTTLNKRKRFI